MYVNMNKKSWRLMLGLLSITFLIYLFQTTSFSLQRYTTSFNPSSSEQISVSDISLDAEDKKAFVTFLCDDVMVIHY
jgi:hypothetical protein